MTYATILQTETTTEHINEVVNGWSCNIFLEISARGRVITAGISRSEIVAGSEITLERYQCPHNREEAIERLIELASRYFVNNTYSTTPAQCRIGERIIPIHLVRHTSTTDYSLGASEEYDDVTYPRYELRWRMPYDFSFFNLLELYAYADDTMEQRLYQRLIYSAQDYIPVYDSLTSVYNGLVELDISADEFAVLNKLLTEYEILTHREPVLGGLTHLSIKDALRLSGYSKEKLIEIRDEYQVCIETDNGYTYPELLQEYLFEDGLNIYLSCQTCDS